MTDPSSPTDAERDALIEQLSFLRARVIGAVTGLDDNRFDQSVVPSGWSARSLLQHLAHDDERFWFEAVIAGDATAVADATAGITGWKLPSPATAAAAIEAYRAAAARTDGIIATVDLGAEPAWWPEHLFGDWRLDTVRDVVLHLITEIAIHVGHLDIARELLDGHNWSKATFG